MVDVGGGANPLEGVLEGTDVFGADVDDGVGVPADGPGIDHLGHTGENAPEICGGDSTAAEQFDVGLDRETVNGRVDVDREPPDGPFVDHLVHSPFYCRCRQADDATNIPVVGSCVVAKLTDDFVVDCVHLGTIRTNCAKHLV